MNSFLSGEISKTRFDNFVSQRGNFNEDAIKRERRADGKDSVVSKENLNEREQ